MKLCTFLCQNTPSPGLLLENEAAPGKNPDAQTRVLDLTCPQVAAVIGYRPQCLEDVIEKGTERLAPLTGMQWPTEVVHPLESLTLLPPVYTRAKIFGVARNYHAGLAQAGVETPKAPAWFSKLPNTVIGHKNTVVLPEAAKQVTYEGEIALIIGKRAKNVGKAEALSHIAGFALSNDVSAADLVRTDGNFLRGKNADTFFPFGPFMVTADAAPDPHDIRFTLEIDGKLLQDGSTSDMVFDMADLICHISSVLTLEPGDVIATGTPAGVAAAQTPPAWLAPGQRMRVSSPGLGVLENTVA